MELMDAPAMMVKMAETVERGTEACQALQDSQEIRDNQVNLVEVEMME